VSTPWSIKHDQSITLIDLSLESLSIQVNDIRVSPFFS
jgi:hypothetical protein